MILWYVSLLFMCKLMANLFSLMGIGAFSKGVKISLFSYYFFIYLFCLFISKVVSHDV